uniref:Uncharacterized protein n=1 Tax=Oryza glumipatula TaxID=40148 RepID=A0A0E0AEW7_9ORYZ
MAGFVSWAGLVVAIASIIDKGQIMEKSLMSKKERKEGKKELREGAYCIVGRQQLRLSDPDTDADPRLVREGGSSPSNPKKSPAAAAAASSNPIIQSRRRRRIWIWIWIWN